MKQSINIKKSKKKGLSQVIFIAFAVMIVVLTIIAVFL